MKSLSLFLFLPLLTCGLLLGNAVFTELVYESSKTYSKGDAVIPSLTEFTLYTAKKTVPAGQNGPPNTAYWQTAEEYSSELQNTYSGTVSTPPSSDNINTSEITNLGTPTELDTGNNSGSKFSGIAARGLVSSSQPMFGGISIVGSEKLSVAFMGKGQSMGVSPYAADPILEIWSTSGKLSENDNWGSISDSISSNLSTVTGISVPTSNTESGMVLSLSPGNYSFVLKSKSGTLAGAMIEAYEVGTSTSKLGGIAARGLVSSSQPMFGGISITGSENKKIAFMGKGQSMGVSPYAADPILEIWSTSGKLSENDNWGSISDSISSSLSTVTGISAPTGTTESGMVMTLAPGNYSFVLKSKSGSLSGAMIEAYEVE